MPPAGRLGGHCEPGFVAVRDAFTENFAERGEVGAAVCVTVDGRPVVDLWGGTADRETGREWGPDTLVDMFSIGKGMAALVAARIVGDGAVDLDRPLARVWPEFAAAGKADVTLRQVLSHQAGLPAVARPLPPGAMLDWELMVTALAEQEPWWEPGTAHGYHTNTFGYLVGEVVRRVTGTTFGEFLAAEVAGPLSADVHVGLAASEDDRVAEFLWPDAASTEAEFDLGGDDLMRVNTYFNPPDFSGAGVVNTRAWRAAEIPSTNGHATARGVARVYAALAAGGALEGHRVVDAAALREAATEHVHGPDLVLDRPSRFGLGFQLPQPERPLGPNDGAFGHFGAGGSLGFCDPDAGVAFGYVMNQMGPRWQNPRNRALVDALYESLA